MLKIELINGLDIIVEDVKLFSKSFVNLGYSPSPIHLFRL